MAPSPDVLHDIALIKAALLEHRAVETPLGVFSLRVSAAYAGLNPRTGEEVPVPKKKAVHLDVSSRLRTEALGADALATLHAQESTATAFRVTVLEPETEEVLASQTIVVSPDEQSNTPAPPREVYAALACDALFQDVAVKLATKRTLRYSGFGDFVRTTHRPPRLEFKASQVWKLEVNEHDRGGQGPLDSGTRQ